MQYLLSITSLIDSDAQQYQRRSAITTIVAEADLGQYSERGFPESFGGKLVGVTPEQLLYVRFGAGIEVGFRGKRYKFSLLEEDGRFELRKGW
ncbi:MAG TPA: hypothetical protein VII95_04295 [Terriglobales bacterium]|jgi:hypothetical protein